MTIGSSLMRKISAKTFFLSGALFLALPFSAQAATVTVNSATGYTSAGLYLNAGQQFRVTATGLVNLDVPYGPYIVDANGTIDTAPVYGGQGYNFFLTQPTVGQPAVAGGYKILGTSSTPGYTGYNPYYGTATYSGGKYGQLYGLFSSRDPGDLKSFTSGLLLGTSGLYTAVDSGYFYLSINDWNRSDNAGSYMVSISVVPLPAALPLFGAGLLAVAGLQRRKRKSA